MFIQLLSVVSFFQITVSGCTLQNWKSTCFITWTYTFRNTIFLDICRCALTSDHIFVHPCEFWKLWNCEISKFSKMHLGNLSQISLSNMGLLVQIEDYATIASTCTSLAIWHKFHKLFIFNQPVTCGIFFWPRKLWCRKAK